MKNLIIVLAACLITSVGFAVPYPDNVKAAITKSNIITPHDITQSQKSAIIKLVKKKNCATKHTKAKKKKCVNKQVNAITRKDLNMTKTHSHDFVLEMLR